MRFPTLALTLLCAACPLCASTLYLGAMTGSSSSYPDPATTFNVHTSPVSASTSLGAPGSQFYISTSGSMADPAMTVGGTVALAQCASDPCGYDGQFNSTLTFDDTLYFSNLTGSAYLLKLDYSVTGALNYIAGSASSGAALNWLLSTDGRADSPKTYAGLAYNGASATPLINDFNAGAISGAPFDNTQSHTINTAADGALNLTINGTFWFFFQGGDGHFSLIEDLNVQGHGVGVAGVAGGSNNIFSNLTARLGGAELYSMNSDASGTHLTPVAFDYVANLGSGSGGGVSMADLSGINYKLAPGDDDGNGNTATPDPATALLVAGGLAFGAWKRRRA